MIYVEWKRPNFRFFALDKHGRDVKHFCYAESSAELIERLERKGLAVKKIEDYDFQEWLDRANIERDKAISDFNEGRALIRFNPAIWRELKWHLFELFSGKCAYCESKPQAVMQGHVEHYRPKAKVREDPKRAGDRGHPGYYWLAYDYLNLLPACAECNTGFGKMNQFPVEGLHARDEASLAKEKPLLLHPFDEAKMLNPLKHLEFDQFGIVKSRRDSLRGEHSVRCYQLNRLGLFEPRKNAIDRVQREWKELTAIYSARRSREVLRCRREIKLGHREYSAAQLCELDRIMAAEGI